jgi:hypothetical protein
VAYSSQGALLATGGTDGKARVWAHPTLQEHAVLTPHWPGEVDALAFSPSDAYVRSDWRAYVRPCTERGKEAGGRVDRGRRVPVAYGGTAPAASLCLRCCCTQLARTRPPAPLPVRPARLSPLRLQTHTHTHTHVHMHGRKHTHIYVHTHTHTQIHRHTHTQTHRHTHTHTVISVAPSFAWPMCTQWY